MSQNHAALNIVFCNTKHKKDLLSSDVTLFSSHNLLWYVCTMFGVDAAHAIGLTWMLNLS